MPNPIPGWRDAPFKGDGTQDLTHAGSPPSWNSLLCNGERLPGLAILVSGPNHKLVSFHGRASGKSPGAPTVRGREPATMTFQLVLRDNAEWDSFVAVAPRLLPIVVGAPAQQGTATGTTEYRQHRKTAHFAPSPWKWPERSVRREAHCARERPTPSRPGPG